MKRAMASFLTVLLLFLSAAEILARISEEEKQAVAEWIRTLVDLKGSKKPLPITQNDLLIVFNLRDLPALAKLSSQKSSYVFDLFMTVDRRGMMLPAGINCYVEDFVTFEIQNKIHVFIKIRVAEIPTPVWTTLAILEYALWGTPAS
jgi:hypothetical protein